MILDWIKSHGNWCSYPCTSGDDPDAKVIPAQAGMILRKHDRQDKEHRYPCTSGDDPKKTSLLDDVKKLSLHKRG